MKNRKLLLSTNTAVLVLVVIGFLGLFNYLGNSFFVRWDMTEGKEFTLSNASKTMLGNLDDIIRIEVYVSKKLPYQFQALKTHIDDLLKEYEIYSKGKVKISYIDPRENEEENLRIRRLGIPEVQATIIEKDQRQTVKVFFGLALFYEDRHEIIPIIQNLSSLEYDVTSALKKVSSRTLKKVGFLFGHGEHNIESDYQSVRKALEKQYEVSALDLAAGAPISPDITTIIAAGSESLTTAALQEIDRFIMQGGKALFLMDEVAQGAQLQGETKASGLNTLLQAYGAVVNSDFVCDAANDMAGFSNGMYTFQLPYPYWPRILQQNLAADNHITEKLEALSLPWCSSITSLVTQNDTGRTFTALAQTTDKGWSARAPFNLNPQQQFQPTAQQQLVVAGLLEGTLSSPFSAQKSSGSGIVIVGDSDFIIDNNMRQFGYNLLFFMNAVDYLTLDASLIAIRSRGKTDRPLQELSAPAKNAFKFLNIFGMSMLVVLLGLMYYTLRKKIKRAAGAVVAQGVKR